MYNTVYKIVKIIDAMEGSHTPRMQLEVLLRIGVLKNRQVFFLLISGLNG